MQAAILLAVLLCSLLLPAFPQPQSYHAFADDRTLLGVPNFWNVVSNLPFLGVGLAGLRALLPAGSPVVARFREPRERWAWATVFAAVLLTGLGSAWYHLAPGDARLVWDRLPIALMYGALIVAILGDHSDRPRSLGELAATLILCAATVIYWKLGFVSGAGSGNLTPYLALTAYVVAAIGVILWLRTPRYSRRTDFAVIVGLYALARVLEWLDTEVYSFGRLLSGHTLKHAAAALACYWLLRMIRGRSRIPVASPQAAS